MTKDWICSVVVSYNPSHTILENVSALAEQVDQVIVVDNGSSQASKAYLKLLEKLTNVRIIYNPDNLGIAAALNIGVTYCIDLGCFWIATFDQDSLVTPGFFDNLLAAYSSCNYKDIVAIISPMYRDQKTNVISCFGKPKDIDAAFVDIKSTMTSGSMVKAQVFQKVGFFDESLFIDYVDHEFCLRCLKNGYKIIESHKCVLNHSLGDQQIRNFLGIEVSITNHSYLRRYYNARNRIFVYSKYFFFSKWVVKDVISFFKEIIKILFLEDLSLLKSKYIIKGLIHGFIGIKGKHE